jgi:hypothetical protein
MYQFDLYHRTYVALSVYDQFVRQKASWSLPSFPKSLSILFQEKEIGSWEEWPRDKGVFKRRLDLPLPHSVSPRYRPGVAVISISSILDVGVYCVIDRYFLLCTARSLASPRVDRLFSKDHKREHSRGVYILVWCVIECRGWGAW